MLTIDEISKLAIAWGPTALFLLIFLIGLIFGLARGLRKSSILAVQALIALGICLTGYLIIVNNPNTDALVVEYTNQALGALGQGTIQETLGVSQDCASLKEILIEYIPRNLSYGDGLSLILKENGAYLGTLVNLGYHIIFALIFSILYILVVFLLYIIYFIFYPERRYKRKKMRKEAKLINKGNGVSKPYKKRRLLGSLIGGTRGLISGLVCMSFIGALFFVLAGGESAPANKDDDYDFGDQNINVAHTIYKNIGSYGETGIFKILNSLKDENDVPYYLFAAELVFQGGDVSLDDETKSNIALTHELTVYTKFARKTFDLILECDDENVIKDMVLYPDKDRDVLTEVSKIMSKEAFQTKFASIIDEFDSNTYFINLGISLIDSVARNIDQLDIGLDEDMTELLCILFKEGYKSDYIIDDSYVDTPAYISSASSILEESDVKHLIKTAVSIFTLSGQKNGRDMDDLEKILALSNKVVPELKKLTLFSDNKKSNNNKVIQRLFTYTLNRYVQQEDNAPNIDVEYNVRLLREHGEPEIDWIDEILKLFDLTIGAIQVTDNVYDPSLDIEKDYLDLVARIFDSTRELYESTMAAYTQIRTSLENSSLLSLVMSKSGMYEKLEEEILKIAPEAYIRPDMSFINTKDEAGKVVPGEICLILDALQTALSDADTFNVIKEIMDGKLESADMAGKLDLVSRLSNIITSGKENERVIDSLLKSDLFSSILSGLIIEMQVIDESMNLVLYLPNEVKEEIDGVRVNLIKNDEILPVLESLPGLIDVVSPYLIEFKEDGSKNPQFESINGLIDRLGDSTALDKLLSSLVVEGTLVNAISGLLSDPALADFVVMPDGYVTVDEATNKTTANVQVWIDNHEIKNIINGVSTAALDIDGIMKTEVPEEKTDLILSEVERIAKAEGTEAKPLSRLLESNLLHYSVSGFILGDTSEFLGDIELYVTDDDKQVDKVDGKDVINEKLIKKEILVSTLRQIPDVLNVLKPYLDKTDESINNLIKGLNGKSTVMENKSIVDAILSVNILHGTMVNALYGILSDPSLADFIVMPDDYAIVDEVTKESKANVESWIYNDEIHNIINGISTASFDIDGIMNTEVPEDRTDLILSEVERIAKAEGTEAKPLSTLLESNLLHYSVSGFVLGDTSQFLGDIELYVTDDDKQVDKVDGVDVINEKLIKREILVSTLRQIPDVLNVLKPYLDKTDESINNLIKGLNGKSTVMENKSIVDAILSVNILHGTMANALYGVLSDAGLKDVIMMPKAYVIKSTTPSEADKPNTKAWIENDEIKNIVNAITCSELNIDELMNSTGEAQMDLMLDELERIANLEDTKPEGEKPLSAMLDSNILYNTLSGVLSGKSNLLGEVKLYVPTVKDADGNDIIVNNSICGDVVNKAEMRRAISAIPTLAAKVLPVLQAPEKDLDKLVKDLNTKVDGKSPVDKLCESMILKYTLADQMTGILEDAGEMVVLPTAYKEVDTDGRRVLDAWFTNDHNEINSLLTAVVESKISLNAIQAGNLDIKKTISGIAGPDKTKEDISTNILGSDILHATISGLIQNSEMGIKVIVPNDYVSKDADKLVDKDTISGLLLKVPAVLANIDEKNNVDQNALIKMIVNDNNNTDPKHEKLLSDPILLPTIVNYLNTQIFPTIEVVKVPQTLQDAAVESELLKYNHTNPDSNAWATEAPSLISAFDVVLGISKSETIDFANPEWVQSTVMNSLKTLNDPVVAGQATTNLSVAYKSSIMSATLTDQLDQNINGLIDNKQDSIDAKVNGIYKETEVAALVKAFNYLEIDFNAPSFDEIKLTKELYNDIVKDSNIIKMALTVQINSTGMAIIPDSALTEFGFVNNDEVRVLIDKLVDNKKALFGVETEKVILANLKVDGLTFEALGGILDSNILYATVVDYLAKTPITGVVIPAELATASSTIKTNYNDNPWVLNQELNKMITSLGVLVDPKTTITGIDTNEIKNKVDDLLLPYNGTEQTNLSVVYDSSIVKCTLSGQLDTIFTDTLKVADDVINHSTIKENVLGTKAYTTAEVTNMLTAIQALGIKVSTMDNPANVKDSILTLADNKAEFDKLDDSLVVWAIVSDQLDSILRTKLSVNEKVLAASVKNVDGIAKAQYTNDAVYNVLKGLKTLVGPEANLDTLDVELVKTRIFTLNENDVTTLHNSNILWSMLSDGLDEALVTSSLVDSRVITANKQPMLTGSEVMLYTDASVWKLLSGIKALAGEGADLDSLTVENVKTLVFDLTDVKINTMSESDILWSVLSRELNNVLATGSLVNTKVLDKNRALYAGTTDLYLYNATEVYNILGALKTITPGSTSMDFNAETVKNRIFDLTKEDFTVISNSKIVWSIVGDQLNNTAAKTVDKSVIELSTTDYEKTGYRLYTVDAVWNLLDAAKVLLGATPSLDGFTVDKVKDQIFSLDNAKLTKLHSSEIVWSLLSDQLDVVLKDITTPELLLVKEIKDDLTATVKVYKQAEILALVQAINKLGIADSLNSFDILGIDIAKITEAYALSAIVKDIITRNLDTAIENTNGAIQNHESAKQEVHFTGYTAKFYLESEISALIGLMKGLHVADMSAFNLNNIDLNNPDIKSNLLASKIINATVTNNLKNMTGFAVPASSVDNGLLTAKEYESFINALAAFNIKLGSPSVDTLNPSTLTDEKLITINESSIMRANITKTIQATAELSLEQEAFTLDSNLSDGAELVVLTSNEINSFIKAIKVITPASTSFEFSIDFASLASRDANDIKTMFSSSIATVILSDVLGADIPVSGQSVKYEAITLKKNIDKLTLSDGSTYTITNNKLNALVATDSYNIKTGLKNPAQFKKFTVADTLALVYVISNPLDVLEGFVKNAYTALYSTTTPTTGVVSFGIGANQIVLSLVADPINPVKLTIKSVLDKADGCTITFDNKGTVETIEVKVSGATRTLTYKGVTYTAA